MGCEPLVALRPECFRFRFIALIFSCYKARASTVALVPEKKTFV